MNNALCAHIENPSTTREHIWRKHCAIDHATTLMARSRSALRRQRSEVRILLGAPVIIELFQNHKMPLARIICAWAEQTVISTKEADDG